MGIRDQFSMIKDSILIVNSLSNNGVYKIKKLVRKVQTPYLLKAWIQFHLTLQDI